MHTRHKLRIHDVIDERARVCDLVNQSFFLEFNHQYVRAVLCLELGSLDGLLDGAMPPVQFAVFV